MLSYHELNSKVCITRLLLNKTTLHNWTTDTLEPKLPAPRCLSLLSVCSLRLSVGFIFYGNLCFLCPNLSIIFLLFTFLSPDESEAEAPKLIQPHTLELEDKLLLLILGSQLISNVQWPPCTRRYLFSCLGSISVPIICLDKASVFSCLCALLRSF